MIPQRFQANCDTCGDELDIRKPGVFQAITGHVKNRKGGGANAVFDMKRLPVWTCQWCMEKKTHGQAHYQATLFS